MSMIARRISLTVPAAGAWSKHRIAGHLFYVESTDLGTDPADMVTIHPGINAHDGFPAYPKLEVVICAGFQELWIKGNTADAGSTLRLLVVSDPCLDLPNVRPNPCGGAAATPPNTSTALVFLANDTDGKIHASDRLTMSFSDFLDDPTDATEGIHSLQVDVANGYLYWITTGGASNNTIRRAKYNQATGAIVGSAETLLDNGSQPMRGIALDVDLNARIYVTDATANRVGYLPLAGGSVTLMTGTFSNPNQLAFIPPDAITASGSDGFLDICLDGVGEIMRYNIATQTDTGTMIGGFDYDEISVYPDQGFVIYRRDASTLLMINDLEAYANETTLQTTTGVTRAQWFDPYSGRVYFVGPSAGADIRSNDPNGWSETDHGAIPGGTVASDFSALVVG